MSDAVQIELIKAVTIGLPSLISAFFSFRAARQSKITAVNTNHIKDELVHEVRQASFAAGEKSERDKNV